MTDEGADPVDDPPATADLQERTDLTLPPAAFSRAEFIHQVKLGERDFRDTVLCEINLSSVDLTGIRLTGADLRGATFRNSVLAYALLERVDLRNANLTKAKLCNANLGGATLEGATFSEADLSEADLGGVKAHGAKFDKANLAGARIRKATLTATYLHGANLRRADLTMTDLSSSQMAYSVLAQANLRDATLKGVDLRDADLLDVITSERTSFMYADLNHAKLRAHTTIDIEGLTERQRMRVQIYDSLAQLRRDYTGIWLWFHLLALFLFVAPYAVFVLRAAVTTAMAPEIPPTARPLYEELGWYIASGGGTRHVVSWTCSFFIFGIFYNLLRASLLYKTHTLYLQHQVTGLPLEYVLEHDRYWYGCYRLARYTFWLNLVVVSWHIYLALGERVVLERAW